MQTLQKPTSNIKERIPHQELEQLEIFSGKWKMEGQNLSGAPVAANTRVIGESSYEWMEGGFFMAYAWDRHFSNKRHTRKGIISFEPDHNTFMTTNVDNLGYKSIYLIHPESRVWKFIGNKERATIKFSGDGNIFTEYWEILTDGNNWEPLCAMTGAKKKGPQVSSGSSQRNKRVDNFFDRYAEQFNQSLGSGIPDVDAVVKSFSDCFVESSPTGIICGHNDDAFRKKIPEGIAYYKKIGITGMHILSKEITGLDNFHFMAKVHWRSDYRKKDNTRGGLEFDVIYFLQDINNELKIFSYITGDEEKALKGIGLI